MKEVRAVRLSYIYGIAHNGNLVYVGRTEYLYSRFMAHRNAAFKHIRDSIKLVVLECCPTKMADYQEYVWINKALGKGCQLTNKLIPKHIWPLEKRGINWCYSSEKNYFRTGKTIPPSFMVNAHSVTDLVMRGEGR